MSLSSVVSGIDLTSWEKDVLSVRFYNMNKKCFDDPSESQKNMAIVDSFFNLVPKSKKKLVQEFSDDEIITFYNHQINSKE